MCVLVCACSFMCVYVCAYVCVLACARHCSRFAHGCWLRPHQGQEQGEGGEQREEERGASIWSQSVWCKLPRCIACHVRCKHSSPALACFVGGLVRRKSPAGMADPSPSCWLTLLSSYSHSVILTVIPETHCNLPGIAFEILPDWHLLLIPIPGRDVQP